jgi:tripartite-type tricarboxylate transporter receptor subunit TctC
MSMHSPVACRRICVLFGLLSALAPARADNWPQRSIQIVVGFSPGGAADALARALAESLAKTLGQPVVVQNRDGGSGTIATAAVAKADPDGYTVGFGPMGPLVLQPHLKQLPYKPSDLVGVCQTFVNNYALAAAANGRFKTMKEVLDAAARKPNAVTYGTGGIGSFPHMAAIQLAQKGNVALTAVPYRGDPPVILALKGGEIDLGTVAVGLAQAQGLHLLGVFSPTRLPEAPDVPTMTEQGLPVVAQLFGGLYAPKGLPPAVLKALESACQNATKSEKYLGSSKSTQQDVVFKSAVEFNKAIERESETQARAVRAANLKLD